MTSLESLRGLEEEAILESAEEPAFERDFHGPNWLDRRREASRYADRDPAVLIVGGGHAGITAAARLKALGVEALVVDRMARIGDNWRKRYHGLKLHNQKHSNHFPYLPFPKTWPKYIPKDKIANWLESYVETMEIDFWTGTTFKGATWDAGAKRWTAELDMDVAGGVHRTLHPRHIVMATSVSGTPNIPDIPTLDRFEGTVVHSSKFASGADWKGRPVYVFGTGTSAHDIAQDLHGNGAHVTIVQRSPTLIVNVEPGAQLYDGIYYGKGPTLEDRDLINVSVPLRVMKKAHRILTDQARAHDAPLLGGAGAGGLPAGVRRGRYGLAAQVSGPRRRLLLQRGRLRPRGAGRDRTDPVCRHRLVHGDRACDEGRRRTPCRPDRAGNRLQGPGSSGRAAFRAGDCPQGWARSGASTTTRRSCATCGSRRRKRDCGFRAVPFAQCRMYSKYLALQIKAAELGLPEVGAPPPIGGVTGTASGAPLQDEPVPKRAGVPSTPDARSPRVMPTAQVRGSAPRSNVS